MVRRGRDLVLGRVFYPCFGGRMHWEATLDEIARRRQRSLYPLSFKIVAGVGRIFVESAEISRRRLSSLNFCTFGLGVSGKLLLEVPRSHGGN